MDLSQKFQLIRKEHFLLLMGSFLAFRSLIVFLVFMRLDLHLQTKNFEQNCGTMIPMLRNLFDSEC